MRWSRQTPTLEILLPPDGILQFGVSEKIYAREALLRTIAALHGRAVITLPDDFRPLIEAVYGAAIPHSDIVPRADIEAAAQEWQTQQKAERAAANVNLLPEPSPHVFDWTGAGKSEADEGAAKNYLRVSTRLGDDSRAALVLSDPDLIAIAQSSHNADKKPPRRAVLCRLFGHKVNLPKWWLSETEGAMGFESIFEGENWLRGHLIVPMQGHTWRAVNSAVIEDDASLGLSFTSAAAMEKGEADAGITG